MRRISASVWRPVSSIAPIATSARSGSSAEHALGALGLNDHRRDAARHDRVQLARDPRALAGDGQPRAVLALGRQPGGGALQLRSQDRRARIARPAAHAAPTVNAAPARSPMAAAARSAR